ncbi:MAG: hypothetical protein GEV08_25200 [Acidimicrobiia bacterium]|nr:hypothetical protein [Acidimicrobiia bacterium]
MLAKVRAALVDAGVAFAEAPAPMAGSSVYLVPADLAKGLEFDHTVVVEPRAIVEEGDQGHALLFVALTRSTRRLALVRSRELPEVLGGPAVEEADEPAGAPAGAPMGTDEVAALRAENERLERELVELRRSWAEEKAQLADVVAALQRLAA